MHFKEAGQLDGDPVIHSTPNSVYAHINFLTPEAAQRAVDTLHRSKIDGSSINVKLSKKQKCDTSFDITSDDQVVGLVLSKWFAIASSEAKRHNVTVEILNKPKIGIRICGEELAVNSVKTLIYSRVIQPIKDGIRHC